ncbi:MAG: hypothetical protein EZS26_000600 [Candidatus Ordinivivax streblomastigis]|uniref:TonB-dependent receptor-like beta-barrel domain-containing protein n=1 Tax=Candidatus Ordinivivax streblomastigis TaxID=2540710 RepID=A0A5M8P5D0_9BACT|nr:MAG: hypothetical protein EZS26_000367 [Candidatus Ordinivivax streblomastigis]KAA6303440.1 MAG: hypothetical protein EZS26_000600 [Candidatus Ordinivivax streblomastigis]
MRLEGGLQGLLENGKWNAKAYFYDSGKGIPGAIVSNVWKRPQRQWDRNFFLQGSLVETWHATSKMETQINVKYANDWMRYLSPDTTSGMYIDNRFTQQEIYASIANKYAILSNWDVNLSADYQENILGSSLKNVVYLLRTTALVALATAFEWQQLKAQASLLGTFVHETVDSVGDKQEYTPSVFLSYKPFQHHDFNLRAFYKRIFRMPTFNDLYYTEISGGIWV